MSKKAISWVVAWSLFWCGHAVSRCRPLHVVADKYEWDWPGWLYQRLMIWSINVQDWGGIQSPWIEVDDD